jgi:hypothetical protein
VTPAVTFAEIVQGVSDLPAAPAVVAPAKAPCKRTNWSKGGHFEKLSRAVNDWLNKDGALLTEKPDMSLWEFARRVAIPMTTMHRYAGPDASRRQALGSSAGHPSLVACDTQQAFADVLRRYDRGNDGKNQRQTVDMLQDLVPALSREQARNVFRKTIRPSYKDVLTNVVKAQASTTKRSAITVPQQYRWHVCVDKAYAKLKELNSGLTPDGKTFEEVMAHFVLGGDEACLLASAGDVKIIGDKIKKKHELHTADSRVSTTIYQVGSPSGATGPTAFLPPGVRRHTGFTDEFLVKHGAAPGSAIVMTPTGYMTEEAWVELAPKMAAGIRAMPIIRDNPQWWVIKIIDGFGPHTSSIEAMELYANARILLLKEEGDSSHVNQSYDQQVAKDDKVTMRDCLSYLRQTERLSKNIISGWDLVHVGLAAVRELSPSSWVTSFKRVNLHPDHRVCFPEWCNKISHFLKGGESFKPETVMLDTYKLLPPFWLGMCAAEKKRCAEIVIEHDGMYSVACVRQFMAEMHIPLGDMQNLRVCLDVAAEFPDQLEREPANSADACATTLPAAITEARSQIADVADGLASFQLHPTSDGNQLLSGLAKFDHMVKLARRSTPQAISLVPSAHLDLEYTSTQRMLLNPTAQDFAMHEIMSHAHGAGAQQALAKRKLDSLGNVRGQSGFANDPARMKRLKSQLDLVVSIADIDKATANEKATAKSMRTNGLAELGPHAISKLKARKGMVEELTKKELCSLAFNVFGGAILTESNSKAVIVKSFQALVLAQPVVFEAALASAADLSPEAIPKRRTVAATADSSDDDPPPAKRMKQTPAAGGADASSSMARRRPRRQEDSSEEESEEEESEEEADEELEEEVEEDEADEEAGTHARALGDC